MSTLAEKIRACLALDGEAAAFVYVEAGRCLALDASDLKTIADAVDAVDASRGQVAALHTEITKLRAQVDERVSVIEAVKWKEETVGALNAELDAAKTEAAALKAKLEESVGVAEPVAWLVGGQSPVVATSAAAAQLCSEDGLDVVPLYRRPPAAEAPPTREDLEQAVKVCADLVRAQEEEG